MGTGVSHRERREREDLPGMELGKVNQQKKVKNMNGTAENQEVNTPAPEPTAAQGGSDPATTENSEGKPLNPEPQVRAPRTAESVAEGHIKATKRLRVQIDQAIQALKREQSQSDGASAERQIALRKLQEAVMWMGMDLKERGAANPYPNSYNPSNAVVDATADGLKL